jgi:hypothetical protein
VNEMHLLQRTSTSTATTGIEIDVPYPPPFSLAPDKQAREPGLPSGCRQGVSRPFSILFLGLCRNLLRLVARQVGAIPRPLTPLQHAPPPKTPATRVRSLHLGLTPAPLILLFFSLQLHDSRNRVTTYDNDPDDDDRRTSTPGC